MTVHPETSTSARKDEILGTATVLFAESGFNGVGMRAIAEAIGIRSSSLYHHYPSKLDILHAIAINATQAFVEAHLPYLMEEAGPRPQRLHAVFYAHMTYFWEHRLEVSVGLRELKELDDERRLEVNEIRARYQHAVTAVIEEGRRDGDFDVDDSALATLAVLNMINGVRDWFEPGGRFSIEEVARRYADIAVYRVLGAARPAGG